MSLFTFYRSRIRWQAFSNCSVNINIKIITNEIAVCKSVSQKSKSWIGFPRNWRQTFGSWALCSSRHLRQKRKTIWNQTFLKSDSGEEKRANTLGFELFNLRCSSSIVHLWLWLVLRTPICHIIVSITKFSTAGVIGSLRAYSLSACDHVDVQLQVSS